MMKLLILFMFTSKILGYAVKVQTTFPIGKGPQIQLPQASLCKIRCSTQNSGSITIGHDNEKACGKNGKTYQSECHAKCDNTVNNKVVKIA